MEFMRRNFARELVKSNAPRHRRNSSMFPANLESFPFVQCVMSTFTVHDSVVSTGKHTAWVGNELDA